MFAARTSYHAKTTTFIRFNFNFRFQLEVPKDRQIEPFDLFLTYYCCECCNTAVESAFRPLVWVFLLNMSVLVYWQVT